jgi:basic membrane protein A
MKKLLFIVSALVLTFALAACGGTETYEIAMITDSGTIDDESFNQGTWEGIVEYAEENDISHKYYKPSEVSDDSYLDAIELAVEGGAKIVVTPGFLFETSIHAAQTQFPDVTFILIDGYPHTGDYAPDVADNTLSIFFNEHESGFLAGYAAVKDGYRNLGFTGGMAVPAVVKFGVGFVAGAYYAANELSVDIQLSDDTYTYFGDFGPSDDFKNIALSWYTAGTEVIFSAAGGAGSSVMAAAADSDAMMIGVDIDQANQSDTVLTSAMKQLGNAVQQALESYYDDSFDGGSIIYLGVGEDGVALPMETSRFDNFTVAQYNAIYDMLVAGDVVVPADYAALETFLEGLTDTDTSNVPSEAVVTGS